MNATAMVSMEAGSAAGKTRPSSAGQEAGGTGDEGAFGNLMNAAPGTAVKPPTPAGPGTPPSEATTADPSPDAAAAATDPALSEPEAAEENPACADQVMALLGLTPTGPPPPAVMTSHLMLTQAQTGNTPAADPTAPAEHDSLADVLRTAPPVLDGRRDTQAPGGVATASEMSNPMLLIGDGFGLEPRPVEPAASSQFPELPATATGDTQRARGAAAPGNAASPQAPHAATPSLQQPVGTPEWNDELGARLAMMLDKGEQLATLRLTPEELGTVEVRISLREGEASVWFGAQAGETRAALEQALPRLRDMFAAGGLGLAHAAVGSETHRDPQRAQSSATLARGRRESGDPDEGTAGAAVTIRRGLLDLYA